MSHVNNASAHLLQKGNKTREQILGQVLLLTSHPIDVTFQQCVRAFVVQKGDKTREHLKTLDALYDALKTLKVAPRDA